MNSKIRSLFLIIALESLAASVFLFLLPKDPNNSVLLGLSFQRLLIILITLSIGGFFVVFSFQTGRVSKIIDKIIETSWIYKILLGILLLFAATAFLLSQIPIDLISITMQNAYQRFQPTLYFTWIVCLQLGMFIYLSKEKITLDANHPLAGKNLIFDIELVEVK